MIIKRLPKLLTWAVWLCATVTGMPRLVGQSAGETHLRSACHEAEGRTTIASCELYLLLEAADSAQSVNRQWAFDRYMQSTGLVSRHPAVSTAWYVRGLTLLVAAKAGVEAREGPLQPSGMSNEAAAGRAFLHAIQLESSNLDAVEALAFTPRPREGLPELRRWVAGLRPYLQQIPPAARLAAARLFRECGEPLVALRWLEASRADSVVPFGVIDLEEVRVRFLVGDDQAGLSVYFKGAVDSSVASMGAYEEALALLAEPNEIEEFRGIPSSGRPSWLRVFWSRRDVQGGWQSGARLREHYRRLEVAWQRYRTSVPQTGRHQAATAARNFDFFAEELLQRYYADNFATRFVDPGTGKVMEDYGEYVRLDEDRALFGGRALYHAFLGAKEQLDDRGLIFLRHGDPQKTARTVGGEAIELWLYERPDGPLLLSFREQDFDGQVGASVLVPTVMSADPLQREQLCHLDSRLCSLDNDPRSQDLRMREGRIVPGSSNRGTSEVARLGSGVLLAQSRAEGEAAIAIATSEDEYRRRFESALESRVLFYGLLDNERRPVLVVPFAISGENLDGIALDTDGRTGYRISLTLRAVRLSDGLVLSLDTLRSFASARPLRKGQHLSGLLQLPVPAGTYSVSLVASQAAGKGSVSTISAVHAPTAGTPAISDLVVGRERGGVTWEWQGAKVPLNPLNAFSLAAKETAEIFYQVAGAPEGTPLRTRIELWVASTDEDRPRISLTFDEVSGGMLNSVSRSIGLDRLEPDVYRLRVVVMQAGRELIAESLFTVVK